MKITKEQVIEKYGEVELKFSRYYKYSFTYSAEVDGIKIFGSYGGSADDIYKEEVTPDSKVKVKDFKSELNSLYINNGDENIFEYYNYN